MEEWITALTYASGTAMLVAFAILHGGAWGLRGPFMQALRADYFGRRSIGMILGGLVASSREIRT